MASQGSKICGLEPLYWSLLSWLNAWTDKLLCGDPCFHKCSYPIQTATNFVDLIVGFKTDQILCELGTDFIFLRLSYVFIKNKCAYVYFLEPYVLRENINVFWPMKKILIKVAHVLVFLRWKCIFARPSRDFEFWS